MNDNSTNLAKYAKLKEINNIDCNRVEMMRMIQQYLRDQGLSSISQQIEDETGIHMEDQSINLFRKYILSGQYDQLFSSTDLIAKLKNGNKEQSNSIFDKVTQKLSHSKKQLILYYIFEQHYIELMEQGKNIEAINVLQKQLVPRSPFGKDKSNLFKLAAMIMNKQNDNMVQPKNAEKMEIEQNETQIASQCQQEKISPQTLAQRESLLQKLHVYLPENSMLLPNRLQTLLQQSIGWQIDTCPYHNIDEKNFSLLKDHECPQSLLPTSCLATLRRHKEQVWFCKFNQQGNKLASVCKDGELLIWSFIQQEKKSSAQHAHFKIQLTHQIREYKAIGVVTWAPNGDWIISCSNKDKDFAARVWDVSLKRTSNHLICVLRKHKSKIEKIQFHTNEIVVSIDLEKLIIIWEITKHINSKGEVQFKGKEFRKIRTPNMFVEFILTQDRFICRKNHPEAEIKIIKFKDLKRDIKQESFTEDYHKQSLEYHQKSREKENEQAQVHHINKFDDIVMEMEITRDGRYLLLSFKGKPRLELWDLFRTPTPMCVQRYTGYRQNKCILIPGFAGVNQTFVICGSEATGEEACIYIWKRDSGELLYKIQGSGFNNSFRGHSNIINQVDGSLSNPYVFVSCSDDETIKLWGVKDKIKIEETNVPMNEVKKIDVKNERINNGSSAGDVMIEAVQETVALREGQANAPRRRRRRQSAGNGSSDEGSSSGSSSDEMSSRSDQIRQSSGSSSDSDEQRDSDDMDESPDDSDYDQTYSDPEQNEPEDGNSEMQHEEDEESKDQASFSPIRQPEPTQDAEMEEEQSYNSYHEEMNDQQIQNEWQNQWTEATNRNNV